MARVLLVNPAYSDAYGSFSVPGHGIAPLTSFLSSRGCPYRCSFCAQHVVFGRRVRFRSVENCLEELREIRASGLRHLTFVDDTLGLDQRRTIALCERMAEERLDFTFQGFTRVNVVTEELLEAASADDPAFHLTRGDWEAFQRYGNAVIRVGDLDERDLVRWQRRALLEFYLCPEIIWYHLRRAGLRAFLENGLAFTRSMVASLRPPRSGIAGASGEGDRSPRPDRG